MYRGCVCVCVLKGHEAFDAFEPSSSSHWKNLKHFLIFVILMKSDKRKEKKQGNYLFFNLHIFCVYQAYLRYMANRNRLIKSPRNFFLFIYLYII